MNLLPKWSYIKYLFPLIYYEISAVRRILKIHISQLMCRQTLGWIWCINNYHEMKAFSWIYLLNITRVPTRIVIILLEQCCRWLGEEIFLMNAINGWMKEFIETSFNIWETLICNVKAQSSSCQSHLAGDISAQRPNDVGKSPPKNSCKDSIRIYKS